MEKTRISTAEAARPGLVAGSWIKITSIAAHSIGAIGGVIVSGFREGNPWSKGARDSNHKFTNSEGSIHYQVHLPPNQDGTSELPVMIALHGCGMTGFGWNSMKSTSQFNDLADHEGFIVVYPTQRVFGSAINCWKSDDPRQQHRNSGDPALLAGIARDVVDRFHADPRQVHVSGASSGAGAAVILGTTYPDVFASVASIAGGEYAFNQAGLGTSHSEPPEYRARQAWGQIRTRARAVPLLVVQGDADTVTRPILATRLIQSWTVVADFVDDGQLNASLDLTEEVTEDPGANGTYPYTRTDYSRADGSTFIESYLVAGMGHAWSGPNGVGKYTDRSGPDVAEIAWDFARRHPMP
jgi:poly(hydroxyalkanoate) depolymerase family esterase